VVEKLSYAVAQMGIKVSVFGLEDEAWIESDKGKWRGAPANALQCRGPKALGYAPNMARCLIEWNPDVVHSHGIWMHPSRSVLQWAAVTGKPYTVSLHGMLDPWAVQNARWKKSIAGYLFEKAHLRGASCLHALCDQEEEAIRAFGLGNPISVIPNGVEFPHTQDLAPPPWKDQICTNSRVMLFLGRLHPKKNLEPFLNAWAKVRSKNTAATDWYLAIGGWEEDGYESILHALVNELELGDVVVFLGPLFGEDKDAAFRNASAFVLPSLSEGLPMTVLEAWSYGVPVLMTESCNLSEGFEAGAGQKIRLTYPEMMKDLAGFLSHNDASLAEMGKKGLQLVSEKFQWSSVAHRMAKVYCGLQNKVFSPGRKSVNGPKRI